MKALIDDVEALLSLTPSQIAAYARAEGWVKTDKYGDHSDIFEKKDARELIIPGTTAIGDYASVVSDIIRILAESEERSELQVYRDLTGADRDVIRVRAPEAADDGSVTVDDGVDIFAKARDMLLSAACSAKERRASYRAGGNKEASHYMGRVRLGQTEHGSFIVTLLAPVPPSLTPPAQQEIWPKVAEEPFERRVTRNLADGLHAARHAVEQAVRGDGYEAFLKAIQRGVSANMCEAVSSLIERGEGLDVSITWARTRPTPEARRRIGFSRGDGEILQAAAQMLRAQEPRRDETLEGYVTGLDRNQTQTDGRVTLKTFIDGRPVSVKTALPPDEYSKAIEAHDDKKPVAISGDLIREGQRWRLQNPRDMRSLSEDDSE